MSRLADAASYGSYGGVNLQYGRLADRIARFLGIRPTDPRVLLLVDFVEPHKVSNRNWIVLMRPQFARAVRAVGLNV